LVRGDFLERNTIEGDSPVPENPFVLLVILYREPSFALVHGLLSTSGNESPEGSIRDYAERLNTTRSPIVN